MATANMSTHITKLDTTSLADLTDTLDHGGDLDPERTTLYVKIGGDLHALLIDEIDTGGDVVFTVGERV